MKITKIILRTFTILAALSLVLVWLTCTNTGLRTTLHIAKNFIPYKISYGSVHGKLIGATIVVNDLVVHDQDNTLQISRLDFDWQMQAATAWDVSGFEFLLPRADLLIQNNCVLNKVSGKLVIADQTHIYNINLRGKIKQSNVNGYIVATQNNDQWHVENAQLNIDKNIASIKTLTDDGYEWNLKLITPELIFKEGKGELHASGKISNLNTIPTLNATINAPHLIIKNYTLRNLKVEAALSANFDAAMKLKASADKLIIDEHNVNNLQINLQGTGPKHSITTNLQYAEHKIAIAANGAINNHIWKSNNLQIHFDDQHFAGTAEYNIKKILANIDLRGKLLDIPSKITGAFTTTEQEVNLNMLANAQNYLNATVRLKDENLAGNVTVKAEDLSLIMRWVPDVTRLKGILKAQASISGTLIDPIIETQADLTQITATFPAFGVKIKPMELHLKGDKKGKFVLSGSGKMRRGPGDFIISGFIEPFKPNMPNEIDVVGTKIEFINNANANLIASNSLKFVYNVDQTRLDITGNLEVHSGNIYFAEQRASTIKSKDVVFINETVTETKKMIAINPNINIRIDEGVHFAGFGLNADISGKFDVSHRHDALYADGRITIKEGTYKLPGQTLQIQKGRLLYPPGTLLVNPVLDIKMLGKHQASDSDAQADLELVVQGTAQAPTISASGLVGNKDKAISQAMLTGSGVLSNNILQEKLKLSEFGLTSKDEDAIDFFDNPGKDRNSIKNKDLVVGRPLGKRFYLQYLHSMGEANERLRLKYNLSKHWSIGVESGSQELGADLSFSIER